MSGDYIVWTDKLQGRPGIRLHKDSANASALIKSRPPGAMYSSGAIEIYGPYTKEEVNMITNKDQLIPDKLLWKR